MIEILAQYPPAYLHSDGRQLFVRAVIAWLLAASLTIDFTLSGYRVSANRGIDQEFAETFEHVIVTQQIYEIGGYRVSCAGGQAMLDFMLAMTGCEHGAELSNGLANHCVSARRGRMRSGSGLRS